MRPQKRATKTTTNQRRLTKIHRTQKSPRSSSIWTESNALRYSVPAGLTNGTIRFSTWQLRRESTYYRTWVLKNCLSISLCTCDSSINIMSMFVIAGTTSTSKIVVEPSVFYPRTENLRKLSTFSTVFLQYELPYYTGPYGWDNSIMSGACFPFYT